MNQLVEKRFSFEFQRHFHNPDDESIVNYYFTVTAPPELFDKYHSETDDVIFFVEEMEQYGVHDFACTDQEYLGYYSYEIKQSDEPTVIDKWRAQLESWGFVLGDTLCVDYDEYQQMFLESNQ